MADTWRIRPHLMLALVAAFVTSCTALKAFTNDPSRSPHDGVIARPGEVLFVPAERRATLAALPARLRDRWCAVDAAEDVTASLPPVRGLRALPDGPDAASEPFARAIMLTAAASFGANEAAARAALIGLLDRWAKADALTRIGKPTANVYYALDRTLLPTIVSFGLIRDDPALEPGQRRRIERWLKRLSELRGPDRPSPDARDATARNNHLYLRASVSMAWGALVGDKPSFRQGAKAYLQALHDMRPDGSLPLETHRGARALWYQRHALASLVTIAEMAMVQGQDLYDWEVRGRSIHTAVRFLLDAIEEPRRVWPYAAANENPGTDADYREQDLSFLKRRGHDRHYMAWAEIYVARFPDRPESRRLLALLARTDPGFRPMIDDYSGGNTTCFFARPEGTIEQGS